MREWLIANNFQGKEGQTIPQLNEDFINLVSNRYIELFNNITGQDFVKADNTSISERIEKNVNEYLSSMV